MCTFQEKVFDTVLNEHLNAFDFGTAEARNQPPKSFKEKDFDSSSTKLHLSGTYIYNINVVSMTVFILFYHSCPDVDICYSPSIDHW